MNDNIPFEIISEEVVEKLDQSIAKIFSEVQLPPSVIVLIIEKYMATLRSTIYLNLLKESCTQAQSSSNVSVEDSDNKQNPSEK